MESNGREDKERENVGLASARREKERETREKNKSDKNLVPRQRSYYECVKIRSKAVKEIEKGYMQNLLVFEDKSLEREEESIEVILEKAQKKGKTTGIVKNAVETRIKKREAVSKSVMAELRSVNDIPGVSLIHAVLEGTERNVEAFIDSCTNDRARVVIVNTKDQFERTPLHYACLLGQGTMAQMLLACGASPETLDFRGRTPLHYSSFTVCEQIPRLLLSYLGKYKSIQQSMLVSENHFTVARFVKNKQIFQSFVCPNDATIDGFTCKVYLNQFAENVQQVIMKANRIEEERILKIDNRNRKYVDWVDDEGKTAVMIAAEMGIINNVRVLASLGAEISGVALKISDGGKGLKKIKNKRIRDELDNSEIESLLHSDYAELL
jgi:ankyrin repeat protein